MPIQFSGPDQKPAQSDYPLLVYCQPEGKSSFWEIWAQPSQDDIEVIEGENVYWSALGKKGPEDLGNARKCPKDTDYPLLVLCWPNNTPVWEIWREPLKGSADTMGDCEIIVNEACRWKSLGRSVNHIRLLQSQKSLTAAPGDAKTSTAAIATQAAPIPHQKQQDKRTAQPAAGGGQVPGAVKSPQKATLGLDTKRQDAGPKRPTVNKAEPADILSTQGAPDKSINPPKKETAGHTDVEDLPEERPPAPRKEQAAGGMQSVLEQFSSNHVNLEAITEGRHFRVGERVSWNQKGERMLGPVFAVVPPNKSPLAVLGVKIGCDKTIQAIIESGYDISHINPYFHERNESCLAQDEKNPNTLYWPLSKEVRKAR